MDFLFSGWVVCLSRNRASRGWRGRGNGLCEPCAQRNVLFVTGETGRYRVVLRAYPLQDGAQALPWRSRWGAKSHSCYRGALAYLAVRPYGLSSHRGDLARAKCRNAASVSLAFALGPALGFGGFALDTLDIGAEGASGGSDFGFACGRLRAGGICWS